MQSDKPVGMGIVVRMDASESAFDLGPNGGLVLVRVEKFSTAYKAGLMVGDELLAFDGKRFATPQEGLAILQAVGVGGQVTVDLVREGAKMQLPMKLFEKKVVKLDLDDISNVLERKISPAA